MIKKLAGIVILSGISIMGIGQTTPTKKTTARPDIPGTFVLELGLNSDNGAPAEFSSLGWWGSRTFNLYYQYEFRILKSPFSFVPGIGLSLERYKFKNNYILDIDNTSGELSMIAPKDAPVQNIQKSQLITNYVEVPAEIRFTLNPDDPARSFKMAVGGRIGYLFDSFTKVKYKENTEVKKFKDKQNFKLTELRYGLTGRIGFGNFSLFGYYNLTPLFKKGDGLKENNLNKDFNTYTIGISLSSF